MNLRLKWSMITAGVAVLMLLVLSASPQSSASVAKSLPYPGYVAPAFTLRQLSTGQTISPADFHGKPIFINFWASWCPPCRAETPDIVKAYQEYGDKVVFISVNLTNSDTVSSVDAFVKQYGIKYPVLLDKTARVSTEYNVLAVPTSVFVNRQGIIVERYSGAIPYSVLISNLQGIEKS